MPVPLRWGILGTGMIARKFAGQLPQALRGELVAVGSRSRATGEAFVAEFGGTAHTAYESVLEDSSVDAIYLSLPNGLHREWTIRALEAGKHVLCEKPISLRVADAVEMFDAAERCNRVLVEAFMYRAQAAIVDALRRLHEGAIGAIRLIRTNFTFDRPVIAGDARYSTEQGGGSLMDVGCYCVHLARAIAGSEPLETHAVAHLHDSGVDDWAAGTLVFPDGLLATFTCGMRVLSDPTTYVCGSKGYMEIEFPWLGDGRFHIVTASGRESFHVPTELPHYAQEADCFAAAVQDGEPPWITRADTLGNLRVLDDLRRSAGVPV